jgi:hypothetical protein
MKNPHWYQRHRHLRLLRDRLEAEGFTITDAWNGKHVRVRVARGGHEGTVTVAATPSSETEAINQTMQKARRIDPKAGKG